MGDYWRILEITGEPGDYYSWRLVEVTRDREMIWDGWRLLETMGDYWRILGDYRRLLDTGDYWRLLEDTRVYWILVEVA